MIATWRQAPLAAVRATPGWHYDDPALVEKLAASLRRHGQLRALVVRDDALGGLQLVDGRSLLQAMRLLGWTEAWVADVGDLDDEAAGRMALDLETRLEVDYAKVAKAVAWLMDDKGAAADSLAAASPFTAPRLEQLRGLATFDWSQFKAAGDDQHGFSWDEDPPVTMSVDEFVQPAPDTSPVLVPGVTHDIDGVPWTEPVGPDSFGGSDLEIPTVQCPGCGIVANDYDGIGFVACTSCGLCTHPSRDGGVCGICGDVETLRESAPEVLAPVHQAQEPAGALQMGLFG